MNVAERARASRSPRLAVVLGGLGTGLMALSIGVTLVASEVAAARWTGSAVVPIVDLLGLGGALVVGTLVAWRRPGNRYGWLLLILGLTAPLMQLMTTAATALLVVGEGDPVLGWIAADLAAGLWVAEVTLLSLLVLLFPDGRPPSPRWRPLLHVVVAAAAVAVVTGPFMPGGHGFVPLDNPHALPGAAGAVAGAVGDVATYALFLAIPLAAASLVARHRRADLQQRLQLRWFLFAAALLGSVIVGTGAGAALDSPLVTSLLMNAALTAVFAAIGVAVLRYRLYEIDRVVSRTVTYATVTALLVGVYAATVVTFQTLLRPVTGESDLAVAGSTLVVAALFGPVRRRVRSVVDRRFNRRRYDAARAVAVFGNRLRDEVDLDEVVQELRHTVATTVAPAGVSLWLPPTAEVSR